MTIIYETEHVRVMYPYPIGDNVTIAIYIEDDDDTE